MGGVPPTNLRQYLPLPEAALAIGQ